MYKRIRVKVQTIYFWCTNELELKYKRFTSDVQTN